MSVDTSAVMKKILATASARRSSRKTESDSGESIDWLSRWLDSIELEADILGSIATHELKSYKAAIEFHTNVAGLQFKYEQLETSTNVERAKIYADILKAQIAAQKTYYSKTRVADTNITGAFLNSVGDSADPVILLNKAADALKAGMAINNLSGKPNISPTDPAFTATMRALLEGANRHNGKKLVVFGRDGLVDIRATQANINARKMSGPEMTNLVNSMKAYNAKRLQEIGIDEGYEEAITLADNRYQAAVAKLRKDPNDAEALNDLEAINEQIESGKIQFLADANLVSKEEAEKELEIIDLRMDAATEARTAAAYAKSKLGGDDQDEVREGLAKGVSNSAFRAWAADHGFDRLGSVDFDKDGKVDVDTYKEGGDDVAALLAWQKQSLRKPGNYGFRAVNSGEIWRVELKDGTEVTGHRLRRHAADPNGAIRIVTAEGARLITPAEASQAQILQRQKTGLSRIDRRARRMFKKNKFKYEKLGATARFRAGEMAKADLAQTENLEYIVDPETGQGITKREFETAKQNARTSASFIFESDGMMYIVDPATAKVYSADFAGNKFTELTDEQRDAIRDKIPVDGQREYFGVGKDGKPVKLFRTADIEALVKGELEIDGDFSGFDSDEFNALLEQDTTLAGLGFEMSPDVPATPVSGTTSRLAGFNIVEQEDTRRISDEDEVKANDALDSYLVLAPVGEAPTIDDGQDDNVSGPGAVGGDVTAEMIKSLLDPNRTPEEKAKLSEIYNERFPDLYRTAFFNLDTESLDFDPTDPTFEPPPPKEEPGLPPAKGTLIDAEQVDEFTAEEMGVAPTETAPGATPPVGDVAPLPTKARPSTVDTSAPGVGKKTPKSLKSVPMIDVGALPMDTSTGGKSKIVQSTQPPTPDIDAGSMSMFKGMNLQGVFGADNQEDKTSTDDKAASSDDKPDSIDSPSVPGTGGIFGGLRDRRKKKREKEKPEADTNSDDDDDEVQL